MTMIKSADQYFYADFIKIINRERLIHDFSTAKFIKSILCDLIYSKETLVK